MLNLSDIHRATLIRIGGQEQECTPDLFEQWLDVCPGDPRKESARVVGALCDVIRQLRNDHAYEQARAERAIGILAEMSRSR